MNTQARRPGAGQSPTALATSYDDIQHYGAIDRKSEDRKRKVNTRSGVILTQQDSHESYHGAHGEHYRNRQYCVAARIIVTVCPTTTTTGFHDSSPNRCEFIAPQSLECLVLSPRLLKSVLVPSAPTENKSPNRRGTWLGPEGRTSTPITPEPRRPSRQYPTSARRRGRGPDSNCRLRARPRRQSQCGIAL